MSSKIKIASIGCGGRSITYLHWLKQKGFDYTLSAIADPNVNNLNYVNLKFADNKAQCFSDGQELINSCDVDGVIIATPNHLHRGSGVTAMRKGCIVLMEKPVAPCLSDLKAIWGEYKATSASVIVGFVLRYAPFYKKLYELVTGGAIGKTLVITAEELMSDRLSNLFARGGWRSDPVLSGGLMLEKCCHDMDILNWFTGSSAVRISSNAARTFLLPNEGASDNCSNCKLAKECRFERSRIMDSFKAEDTGEMYDLWATTQTDDSCIYRSKSGYPDHQTVQIEYDNGILCNFTVAQGQPINTRTMRILGTKGQIYADFSKSTITVFKHAGPNNQEIKTIEINHDGSGHGGSDSVISTDYINLLNGKKSSDRPGIREGIESAMMCLAADESARTKSVISLDSYRKEVFG